MWVNKLNEVAAAGRPECTRTQGSRWPPTGALRKSTSLLQQMSSSYGRPRHRAYPRGLRIGRRCGLRRGDIANSFFLLTFRKRIVHFCGQDCALRGGARFGVVQLVTFPVTNSENTMITSRPPTDEPTHQPTHETINPPTHQSSNTQFVSMCAKAPCLRRKRRQIKNLQRGPQSCALSPGYIKIPSVGVQPAGKPVLLKLLSAKSCVTSLTGPNCNLRHGIDKVPAILKNSPSHVALARAAKSPGGACERIEP